MKKYFALLVTIALLLAFMPIMQGNATAEEISVPSISQQEGFETTQVTDDTNDTSSTSGVLKVTKTYADTGEPFKFSIYCYWQSFHPLANTDEICHSLEDAYVDQLTHGGENGFYGEEGNYGKWAVFSGDNFSPYRCGILQPRNTKEEVLRDLERAQKNPLLVRDIGDFVPEGPLSILLVILSLLIFISVGLQGFRLLSICFMKMRINRIKTFLKGAYVDQITTGDLCDKWIPFKDEIPLTDLFVPRETKADAVTDLELGRNGQDNRHVGTESTADE